MTRLHVLVCVPGVLEGVPVLLHLGGVHQGQLDLMLEVLVVHLEGGLHQAIIAERARNPYKLRHQSRDG